MKKEDFVFPPTTHIILWNGNKHDLEKYLRTMLFPTEYKQWKTTKEKIIETIMSKIDEAITRDEWINNKIKKMQKIIKDINHNRQLNQKSFDILAKINGILSDISIIEHNKNDKKYDWALEITFDCRKKEDAITYIMQFEGTKIYHEDKTIMFEDNNNNGFYYVTV